MLNLCVELIADKLIKEASLLDNPFDAVKDLIRDITENPDIVEYKLMTDICERTGCAKAM